MIKKAGDSLSLGKIGKPLWLIVIDIVFAIILGYTTFYTIPPGHQGLILRFGRYYGLVMPGLHFRTLETYKEAADKNAYVILGTDSDYYRSLKTILK